MPYWLLLVQSMIYKGIDDMNYLYKLAWSEAARFCVIASQNELSNSDLLHKS